MKLFITGASGYLGTGLLKRSPAEWQMAGAYLTQPLESKSVFPYRLDVGDQDAVDRALNGFRPDVVIHTAALARGPAMPATNAEGSRHVARAAARIGARLIHLSTDVVFDGQHPPYDEDAPTCPISPYGESKALAETAVKDECPGAVIVRTSLVYSLDPPDARTQQTLDGGMPHLFTDEYRCPILRDDLADALLELVTSDYAGVLNVAGPQRLSRYEFGVMLARAFGIAPRFAPALSASSTLPRPRDCTLDISRAEALLRTRLRSVEKVMASLRFPSS